MLLRGIGTASQSKGYRVNDVQLIAQWCRRHLQYLSIGAIILRVLAFTQQGTFLLGTVEQQHTIKTQPSTPFRTVEPPWSTPYRAVLLAVLSLLLPAGVLLLLGPLHPVLVWAAEGRERRRGEGKGMGRERKSIEKRMRRIYAGGGCCRVT